MRFVCISGLVVEYVVAIDVTRVRFPADALFAMSFLLRNAKTNRSSVTSLGASKVHLVSFV